MSEEAKRIVNSLLAEMALTLRPVSTGLPFDIWISEKVYASGKHNRPRLKVRDKGYSSVISLDDPISVIAGDELSGDNFKAVSEYIVANRSLLLQLWNEEIDQETYLQSHLKIGR